MPTTPNNTAEQKLTAELLFPAASDEPQPSCSSSVRAKTAVSDCLRLFIEAAMAESWDNLEETNAIHAADLSR